MARSFGPNDLVQLPRKDAASAYTWGIKVINTAKKVKLPAPAAEAYAEVKRSHGLLSDAVYESSFADVAEKATVRDANLVLNGVWFGFQSFVTAWTYVPGSEEAVVANTLIAHALQDGVTFMRLAALPAYAGSAMLLRKLDEDEVSAQLDQLGGTKFRKALHTAHKAYADALGLDANGTPPVTGTNLRDNLANFYEALRGYVVQLSAMQRKSDPKGTALSLLLLQPIVEADSSATNRSSTDDGTTTDAPAEGESTTVTTPVTAPATTTTAPAEVATASTASAPPAVVPASSSSSTPLNGSAAPNGVALTAARLKSSSAH